MLRRTLYLLNSKKIGNDIISQYGQYMLIPPDKNSNWPSNLPVKAIIIGSNELYKNNTATHNSIISGHGIFNSGSFQRIPPHADGTYLPEH